MESLRCAVDLSTDKGDLFCTRNSDGKKLSLTMSDEFNDDNRDFSKGKDLLFEAIEKPDNTNEALQFCKLVV